MPYPERHEILLIDDDAALLAVLPETLRLRMPELTVTTASSPQAGIEAVARTDFNVIVCDLKMPGMSGFDLVGHIRNLRPWTPILLMSGHGEEGLAKKAMAAGAYDFIAKPLDRDEFVFAVKRALEAYDLRLGGPEHLSKGFMLSILGLDSAISLDKLRALFAPYGKILWARLIVNSNAQTFAVGYVEMATKEAALAAIAGLDGTEVLNRPIRVGPSLAPFAKHAI